MPGGQRRAFLTEKKLAANSRECERIYANFIRGKASKLTTAWQATTKNLSPLMTLMTLIDFGVGKTAISTFPATNS